MKAVTLSVLNDRFAFAGDEFNRITGCNVHNVCTGLIAAAVSPDARGRCYHVSDELRPAIRDFISCLLASVGLSVP